MSHFEVFKVVVERWRWIFFIFGLTALSVAIYQWNTPYIYRSLVKIFVEDEEFYSKDLDLVKSSPQSRISYDASSTEMNDFLIQKFDLYRHFGIDSNSFMHYEKVTRMLARAVTVNCEGHFILNITVSDRDKFLAADMANEIYKKLNEMNRTYIIAIAEKKLNIYKEIVVNNRNAMTDQTQEFSKLIDECRTLSNAERLSREQVNLFSDIKIKLGGLETQLNSINNELLHSTKVYELTASAMQKDNIATLRVVNVALPDTRHPFNVRFYNTALLSLIAASMTIFSIIIFFEFRPYFRLALNI